MKREILVIALLVVLALCIPAGILWNGLSDAQERVWLECPYEGTLVEFQQEHIALLNEAAAVFWTHPEYGEQCMSWRGVGIAVFDLLGDRDWYSGHGVLTVTEGAALQKLYGVAGLYKVTWRPGLYSIKSGWLDIPVLVICVRTTAEGWDNLLIWLPEETDPEAAAQVLELLGECYDDITKTAYPNWYAAVLS
ncbi:MAG: hypothetical protein IKK57_11195 [Clostridia bacterium]|nr:hypothetical protein [Clostridia bacterium]